jgi:hypothetical protein
MGVMTVVVRAQPVSVTTQRKPIDANVRIRVAVLGRPIATLVVDRSSKYIDAHAEDPCTRLERMGWGWG